MKEISDERKRELENKIKQAIVLLNEVSVETELSVSIMTSDTGLLKYVTTYVHDLNAKPRRMYYLPGGVDAIDGFLDKEPEIAPSELEKMKKEEEDEEDGENE